MKYWTIQTNSVFDDIQSKGYYQPDFSKSRYLNLNNELNALYNVILESFNSINHINLPGIVFAFVKSDGNRISSFSSYEEFKTFMTSKKAVIDSLWKHLKTDAVIAELDYEDDFNPIFIDINDFQFLMPPIMLMPPYTEESLDRILRDISLGQISHSEFPSYIIQAHLPYIRAKNLTNVYPFFDLE